MTAYEMRISDWSSDVCSSDLRARTDLGGSALRLFGVAAGDRHLGAELGKAFRDAEVDPAGAPRDEGGLALEQLVPERRHRLLSLSHARSGVDGSHFRRLLKHKQPARSTG